MSIDLIFSCIPVCDNEKPQKTETILRAFLVDKLKLVQHVQIVDSIKFEHVHRTSKKIGANNNHNIVAKFLLPKLREQVN